MDRYIGDPTYGDPVSQLDDVLRIIKAGTKNNLPGKDHSMAQLDALYAHIMSEIPANAVVHARKLLLLSAAGNYWSCDCFQSLQCNMLGMTQSTAYGATHHIHSIAFVPGPSEATRYRFKFFHKSFNDYLIDYHRSGFSPDIMSETRQLECQCVFRILGEAPDGVCVDGMSDAGLLIGGGLLPNGHGTGDDISLSWPLVREEDNHEVQLDLYRSSVTSVMFGFSRGEKAYQSLLCIRLMTSFVELPDNFPWDSFRDFTFVSLFLGLHPFMSC